MERSDIMTASTILPILKSPDWSPPGSFPSRPLDGYARSPSVFFGWDQPEIFRFLTEDAPCPLEGLEQAAIANLAKRRASWTRSWIAELELSFLSCGDDFLAAERIMDARFLARAHAELETPMLVVAIPHRGALIAAPPILVPEVVNPLRQFVHERFRSGVDDPVSDALFVVENGELVGRVFEDDGELVGRALEDGRSGTSPPVAPPEPTATGQVQVTTRTTTDRGTLGVNLFVSGGETFGDIEEEISRALEQVLSQWSGDVAFSGAVTFEVALPSSTERSGPAHLAVLERSLAHELRSLRTVSGHPYRIVLRATRNEFEGR